VKDATAPRGAVPPGASGLPAAPAPTRRRLLQLALLLPAAVAVPAGCSRIGRNHDVPDPLVALAEAARADAALAAAAIAADSGLAGRIEPLRAARAEHAAALEAEVVRASGTTPPSATADPTASPTPPAADASLTRVREAVAAAQRGAADLVPNLPVDRVGLVASVAACCATYAAVLA
jgi:hypothetical protein